MNRVRFLLSMVAISLALILSVPALAANPDMQNYQRAFVLIDTGHPLEAEIFIAHGRDPVLNKVLQSIVMAMPGNDYSFEDMANFILSNPEWPNLRSIYAIAEQKIPLNASQAQVINWFVAHPPVSLVGFYRYVDTLSVIGDNRTVVNLVHDRWINGDFSPDELAAFHARFVSMIGAEENWQRLDRLLWKEDATNARRLYPYINANMKALAEARIGLAAKASNVDALVENVPDDLQDDPGLLYERLRWHIRNNQDDQSLDILRHAPDNLDRAEAWWDQRQTMVRRLMDRKDYEGAYRLAANHGKIDAKHLADAEFLAGWLSLRFLDDLGTARQHFQTLYDNASTPISRARGAYWLGRTYEAHGDKDMAEQAYETAAALNITYYGQLAAARIYQAPMVTATPEPTIPPAIRNAFYSRDIIRAVERLHDIGERERARVFFHTAVEAAQLRADFALLTELAYRIDRPDLAIEAGKAATQKNMLITAGGFPLLDLRLPSSPDPAFTHALIRQESMFNVEARSPVGAVGLMQLMPATAKGVARKMGISFNASRLADPDYNIRLGSAFVQGQIDSFDGSYILALAGYNAGPHRVREWMTQIGDPRRSDVDAIDWVEEIPLHETRNYVQRIIESLQIYRARLAGGKAPLQIMKDLKR